MSGKDVGRCLRWLPAPFPDETLHSIFSRYHKLSGHGDYRRSLEDLTGVMTCNAFHDTPSFLKAFSDRAQGVEAYSIENLILHHTLYPYIKRFLLDAQVDTWHERIKGGLRRSGGGQGLGYAHVRGQVLPRYCSQCGAEDLCTWGQSYWHRVHQLPGVWICPLHKQPLVCVDGIWLAKDQRRLFMPDDSCLAEASKVIDVEGFWGFLSSVSEKSSILLFSDAELFSLSYAHNLTRRACECLGFIFRGCVSSKKLARRVSEFFESVPHGCEFQFIHPAVTGALPTWVLEVLRAPYRYRYPLEYLVLWEILGISIAEEGLVLSCDLSSVDSVIGNSLSRNKRKYPRKEITQLEVDRRREEYLKGDDQYSSKKRRSYQWLLKHDRKWLAQRGASRKPGRRKGYSVAKWEQRDIELSVLIVTSAELIKSRGGLPVRLTAGTILRELGLSRSILYYANRLPRCVAALASVQESTSDFARRRVLCACDSGGEDKLGCELISDKF